jgi:hypothetical protein
MRVQSFLPFVSIAERLPFSLGGRIFCRNPEATFPENAPALRSTILDPIENRPLSLPKTQFIDSRSPANQNTIGRMIANRSPVRPHAVRLLQAATATESRDPGAAASATTWAGPGSCHSAIYGDEVRRDSAVLPKNTSGRSDDATRTISTPTLSRFPGPRAHTIRSSRVSNLIQTRTRDRLRFANTGRFKSPDSRAPEDPSRL